MPNDDRRDRRAQLVAAGDWLRAQRERLAIPSAAELARRLGVDRSLVNNWENGKNAPSEEVMPALADQLGVTVDDVRRAYGLYTSEPRDADHEMSGEQVDDLLAHLRQRLTLLQHQEAIDDVRETIRLLELAQNRQVKQQMIDYGEFQHRRG